MSKLTPKRRCFKTKKKKKFREILLVKQTIVHGVCIAIKQNGSRHSSRCISPFHLAKWRHLLRFTLCKSVNLSHFELWICSYIHLRVHSLKYWSLTCAKVSIYHSFAATANIVSVILCGTSLTPRLLARCILISK